MQNYFQTSYFLFRRNDEKRKNQDGTNEKILRLFNELKNITKQFGKCRSKISWNIWLT